MVCVSVLSPAGPGIRCKQVVDAPFTPTLHSSGVGVKLSRSVYTAAFPLADICPLSAHSSVLLHLKRRNVV